MQPGLRGLHLAKQLLAVHPRVQPDRRVCSSPKNAGKSSFGDVQARLPAWLPPDQTCRECPKECLSYRDKTYRELERSKKLGIENGFFCINCRKKDSTGHSLYSDLLTGECVTKCDGFGTFSKRLRFSGPRRRKRARALLGE